MDKRSAFTFEWLDSRIDVFVKQSEQRPASNFERWMFAITLLLVGAGLLIAQWVNGPSGVTIIKATLAIEAVGLGTCLVLTIRRNWREFTQSRRHFSQELDHDYLLYQDFVRELVLFDSKELARALRYISARKGSMTYRLGLVTGGVERLGVLPVLVALYLQLKDWDFGDWESLTRVNMVGGLLLWALLLLYGAGWWLIRLRVRLDTYEALLTEAVEHPLAD